MHPMLNIALRAARKAGDLIERAAENIDKLEQEHEEKYGQHKNR